MGAYPYPGVQLRRVSGAKEKTKIYRKKHPVELP
jgi:hypothetical protein